MLCREHGGQRRGWDARCPARGNEPVVLGELGLVVGGVVREEDRDEVDVGGKMGGCSEAWGWMVVEQRWDERVARRQLRPRRREILILRITSGRLALHKPHDSRESCFVGIYLSVGVVVDGPARL